MFILDTNVVSELRRPERADRNVLAWSGTLAPAEAYLSAITVLELELGILLAERSDATKGRMLRRWLQGIVLPLFEQRILPVDAVVALACARLHVPSRRGERDAYIAATALVHGMTVATRNTRDFAPTGVATVDPWTHGAGR